MPWSVAKSVVTVLDHRPQDPVWLWGGVDLTLRPVGSCSTLVSDKLLSLAPQLVTPAIAVMLLVGVCSNLFHRPSTSTRTKALFCTRSYSFEAKNIKATRKQFLPLIRKVGETLSSTQ